MISSTLEGGLTVVTERMAGVRSVALGFWVGAGSVDEGAAVAGASHFLEHLLFKGTADRSARQIAEAVDAVGGDMNAFTTKEYTAFHIRVLAPSTGLAADIISDIVWAPALRPDEVDAERRVILEELSMQGDEPADLVHDAFARAMWPDHPLGREVLGDSGTIEAMTGAEIAAFHGEHYRPGNVVAAAAGDVDHDDIVATLSARLGERRGGRPPARAAVGAGCRPVVVVSRDTEQAHLVVGARAPVRSSDDRFAMSVLDHVLGGGMSSRLFQSVREARGLAYSVYSYHTAYEHSGSLAAYAGTAPSQVGQVLALVGEEMDRMADKGPTPGEVDAARSHLRGATALGLEDSGARMARIGTAQLVHGSVMTVEEVEERLDSLTVAEIRDLAGDVLGGSRSLAVVGPFGEEDFAP
ncbi:MAG: M16 family metallopeptidase [Acidimicrobiales bacterium]